MRIYITAIFLLFLSVSHVFSQTSQEIVSPEVKVKVDQVHGQDSVEVSFTLKLGNLKDVKWIRIRYGAEMGNGNLVAMDFSIVETGGQSYLRHADTGNLFPINKGTVEIKKFSFKEALVKSSHLEIKVLKDDLKEMSKVEKSYLK